MFVCKPCRNPAAAWSALLTPAASQSQQLEMGPAGSSPHTTHTSSRTATNELLAGLRDGRWRLAAWVRFFTRAGVRSWQQARARPQAVIELTAMHAALAAFGGGRRWVAASWTLSVMHLGLLESRSSLAAEDLLTLVRANLPAIGGGAHLVAAAALASDVIDGRLARNRGTDTPFGRDADALADAAFWTWYAQRHVRHRALRVATLATFVAPAAAVTAASVVRGRMVDAPRPQVARPAAALQTVLTAHAILTARRRHTNVRRKCRPLGNV